MDSLIVYPDQVLNGVMESLRQASEEQLLPFTGVADMLTDTDIMPSIQTRQ